MSYLVALAPDLGISATDFAAAWNAGANNPTTARVAQEQTRTQFADPLLVGAVQLIGDLGVGVASGAILELIKDKFAEKTARRKVRIIQATRPDGSTLLAVTAEEE